MKFTFTHPMHSHPYNPELVTGSGIATVAAAAEAAGFHGFGFTDHPAPIAAVAGVGRARRAGSVRGDGFRRGSDDDAAADPEHRGAAVPQPVRGGEVRCDAGPAVRRPVHPRRRRRLPEAGIRRAGTSTSTNGRQLFEEALEVIRAIWTTDDFSYRGPAFHGEGHHRASAAGEQPASADLDRRQHRRRAPASGHVRRRLVPVPGARRAGSDRTHRGDGLGDAWPRASTICAADSRPRAGIRRASTSRSPTSTAAARATTTSTPTPTCPAWKSLRQWA